jgi:hypothetical protein
LPAVEHPINVELSLDCTLVPCTACNAPPVFVNRRIVGAYSLAMDGHGGVRFTPHTMRCLSV